MPAGSSEPRSQCIWPAAVRIGPVHRYGNHRRINQYLAILSRLTAKPAARLRKVPEQIDGFLLLPATRRHRCTTMPMLV